MVVPYLFSVLGAEKFGLVAFAQALVTYFGLFINYGFNLSATAQISIHREDPAKISEVYSTVTTIKLIFSIIGFFIFSIMIFSFDRFSEDWRLYLFTFGAIIESILFPVWFFQGMERMKYITVIYTLSKIVVTAMIFVIISNQDDYIWVPIIYFIGAITSGVLSLYVLVKQFRVEFKLPTLSQITYQLQSGWHLFTSNLSVNMYRNANVVILGFLSSSLYVGYYALAEKIIKALQSLMGPVGEVLFPYFAKKSATQSLKHSLFDIFKIAKIYSIILICISLLVVLFAPYIVSIIGGERIDHIIIDIRILSIVIIFGGLNYLLGIVGLINLGHKEYFMKSVLFAGLLNVMLCVSLSTFLNDAGAAISLSISELILFILLFKKSLSLKKSMEHVI